MFAHQNDPREVCVSCKDYSPSVWDLLRKMVLARAWSDGLDSTASSEETKTVCSSTLQWQSDYKNHILLSSHSWVVKKPKGENG